MSSTPNSSPSAGNTARIPLLQQDGLARRLFVVRDQRLEFSPMQQRGDAADMVEVVMRHQNPGKRQISLRQGLFDRGRVAGIHRHHLRRVARRMD